MDANVLKTWQIPLDIDENYNYNYNYNSPLTYSSYHWYKEFKDI